MMCVISCVRSTHFLLTVWDSNSSGLDIVEQFDTYEDYLDSQLTATDLNYLEDEDMARQLVELGYRGLGDTIRREVRWCDRFHAKPIN